MRKAHVRILVVLLVVACGVQFWTAAKAEDDSGKGDISKGKILYVENCAGCHGSEGKGDGYRILGPDPANLTSPSTQKKSDSDLLRTIHEGKPNMPSWKVRLSEQDSRAVLAYIRTLAK
jgi:mono/diheme cytochrome c family protein